MKACTQMTKAELIQSIAQLKKRQSAGVVALAHERMAQDLEVHQVELETQNQELQGAQHLLEDSRDRYADLYDFAPVGLLTLDSRGTIREINLTACAMLGAERLRSVSLRRGRGDWALRRTERPSRCAPAPPSGRRRSR